MLRYRPFLEFSALYLLLSVLLRISLWGLYGLEAGVGIVELFTALFVGILNDLVVLVYLLAVFQIYILLIPDRWYRGSKHRYVFGFITYALLFGLLYLQAVEICFFDEFNSRFNLVAVDYLMYPTEVLVNLWESYPVIWVLVGNGILSLILFRWFWPHLERSLEVAIPFRLRAKFATGHFGLIVLCALSLSTTTFLKFENRVANQIAANGISSFFEALRTDEIDYHAFYRTLSKEKLYSTMRKALSQSGGKFISSDPSDLTRHFEGRETGFGKLNVVIVSEESLGAGFVGAYGNDHNLTPHFDALAKQGWLFKQAYATGTRTVRGLEAISASFPPIPSESIIKRPGNEEMATVGALMRQQGYQTSFIYGGYGLFDNMNHFFGHAGFDTSDRSDMEKISFANIWGVCDEDLFDHALQYFDKVSSSKRPFFSIVMTTSNHKPYSFPSGIPGVPESGGGRDAGVRYADYSIGKLFEKAQKHSWFDDTIFVVVADHDARVYGRALVPVERYRIPLLIYSPKHLGAREVDLPISQIDIVPTVLGMLGLSYDAPFYGADLFDPAVAQPRPIMMSHNHDVAMMQGDHLTILGLNQAVRSYHVDQGTFNATKAFAQSEVTDNSESVDLLTAYLQSGYELFKARRYKIAPERIAS